MNKWFGTGFLVNDPLITQTTKGQCIARFTIGCAGWKKDENGKPVTEFIPCVAWNERAEFISTYFKKGNKVGVVGAIEHRTYEKEGITKSVAEIYAEQVELLASKSKEEKEHKRKKDKKIQPIEDYDDLPF